MARTTDGWSHPVDARNEALGALLVIGIGFTIMGAPIVANGHAMACGGLLGSLFVIPGLVQYPRTYGGFVFYPRVWLAAAATFLSLVALQFVCR